MRGTVQELRSAAIACAHMPLWSVPDAEITDLLRGVHQAEQAVIAAKLHLIRQADARGIARAQHEPTTARWLRSLLRLAPTTARDLVALAQTVEQRPALDAALSTGAVHHRQAAAIADTVTTLPRTPGADGRVRLDGWLSVEAAAIVTAALDPLCAPRHRGDPAAGSPGTAGTGSDATADFWTPDRDAAASAPDQADGRTPRQRRADALVDVCRLALTTGELPTNGGDRPQITVTIAYDALQQAVGAATLDTATVSPQRPPAGSPATRRSCPPFSARAARSSTSATPGACSPGRCAGPSSCVTGAARSPAAPFRRAGATVTTSDRGCTADPPASTTRSCSAATTTVSSTTATGRSGSGPTATPNSWHPRSSTPGRSHAEIPSIGEREECRRNKSHGRSPLTGESLPVDPDAHFATSKRIWAFWYSEYRIIPVGWES
jgi:hypothetical protein